MSRDLKTFSHELTNTRPGIYDGDNSSGKNSGTLAPAGSAAIEKVFQQHFERRGINHTSCTPSPFLLTCMDSSLLIDAFTSGSDYRPFLDVGVILDYTKYPH